MTLPGMWGIERFGRRRLLLVGAVGMCVSEFIVAIIGVTISTTNQSGQKALVAFVCIYIVRLMLFLVNIADFAFLQAFFASTWGPVAWVVTGEIFPLAVRAKAMSLSTASNW
jgi:SP family sugar:H+ symporter-like MFS transporter